MKNTKKGVGLKKQLKDIPNSTPHCNKLKTDKYIPPPYREVYKNSYIYI